MATAFVFPALGHADAAVKAKAPKPSYPPLESEYYPTRNAQYPEKMTNPSAHTRVVPFSGAPLDVFTQIDMVTQLVLPSPPLLVNIGKPEGYTVEVVPEFNAVFIKPVQEVEMTNLIVTTEDGVYIFILKENPFKPWDVRVQVTNPYRNAKIDDVYTMTWMAYHGKRPAEWQFLPIDLRSPNSTAFAYDPVSRMGVRIALRRAVGLPRQGKCIYWLEFENVLPASVKEGTPSAAYAIDERGIWTNGLERVVVPNPGNRPLPVLSKGDRVEMFLVTRGSSLPPMLSARFVMHGSRDLPIQVTLPTAGSNVLKPVTTTDEKLTALYNGMVQSGQIKPGDAPLANPDGSAASGPAPSVPGNQQPNLQAPTGAQTPPAAQPGTASPGVTVMPEDAIVFPAPATQAGQQQ